MTKFLKISFVAFLSLGAIQLGYSQDLATQNFVITNYTLEDGLPQSSVNDIIQTRDGYIWLATNGGLVRFDGVKFTTYDQGNVPGMISNRLLRLYEAKDGAIWIFPENPVSSTIRFFEGKATFYQFELDPGYILSFNEDFDGRLWVSAFEKVFLYQDGEFIEIERTNDPKIVGEALAGDGIWLTDAFNLLKTFGDKAVLIKKYYNEGEYYPVMDVIEFPENSGEIFGGTMNWGIIRDYDGRRDIYNGDSGLPNNSILKFRSYNDTIFAIAFNSVYYWDGNTFKVFYSKSLPENIELKSILLDKEGNFWVGTPANGLYQLRPSVISMIDQTKGLENEIMLSIEIDQEGKGLLSTNCGGIYDWDGKRASVSKIHQDYDGYCNRVAFKDSKGRMWLGSDRVFMKQSSEDPGKYLWGNDDGFRIAYIDAFFEDSKQNIWIAASNGVFKYDGQTIKRFSKEDGLNSNSSHSITEAKDGSIWVGNTGLAQIKNGKIRPINLIESENVSKEQQPVVRAIYEDEDGNIWAGTYGNGLFRIKEGKVEQISQSDGLFDNVVSHIVEDESGYFWMGSNRGISRVKRQDLIDYLDGNGNSFSVKSFGKAEGMNSAETNGGFQPNASMDRYGKIYFPTMEGVAIVNSREVQINETTPSVYIENLRTIDSTFTQTDQLELNYDTSFLEIAYTAVSFTEPEKVEFKYRMLGLNDTWIDVGNRRSAVYTKMPPGKYTFQVIAANNDGVWSEEGANLSIWIKPAFWQTWWFYGLEILALFGIGFGIYLLRIRRLQKENEQQKWFTEQLIDSQEQERRRIASELHDGLGQQILVIKNRAELAKMQVNDPEGIKEQLDEIMESALISISEVRTISHDLRPVHLERFGLTEALNNLGEQLKEATEIDWSFHFDDLSGRIPEDKEIHFYRVLQEAINNVVKHSMAKEASIFVTRSETEINATIWDDGIGLKEDNRPGLGFVGMKERIDALRGSITIQSTRKTGTQITIKIPHT